MKDILSTISHRSFPPPETPWRQSQRWNDLLFAHWPVRAEAISGLLPSGLELDIFDGWAWVGVVPFHMDQIVVRPTGVGNGFGIPGATGFPELNLRTYVRSTENMQPGVYFFSLDAASVLAVIGARLFFSLPYFWASMQSTRDSSNWIRYRSHRLLTAPRATFAATYRSAGKPSSGPLEQFLTERYCLFTHRGGDVVVGNIHHLPWPLEAAEAEFEVNDLAIASGIQLPDRPPVLHFSRELVVYIWELQPLVGPATAPEPVPA